MADLTTIILTYNEEKNIEKCILSAKKISKRIIVMDSYSTDNTVNIAKKLGADVYQNEFESQSQQFNYTLENYSVDTAWIMKLDADERLNGELQKEIEYKCESNIASEVNGIILRIEVNFLGKSLKHGGIYPIKRLSIFKNGFGYVEQKLMDEHIVLKKGKTVEIKNADLIHQDYKDLTAWIDKHNKYSSREVEDYFNREATNSDTELLDRKAKIKRYIKYNLYYKLPMGIRAKFYYYYRYYLLMGFLDGKEGQIYAFLQAYWYRYLVDAKIYERRNNIK